MKRIPRLLQAALLFFLGLAAPLLAQASAPVAEVQAADDERVAATIAADSSRLGVLLSDGLRYAHSNGSVDTKATLIESLVSQRTKYKSFRYTQREFVAVADTIVLMHGKAQATVESGGQERELDLAFLAVWRAEAGQWRFLAWQSSRNPPPASAR